MAFFRLGLLLTAIFGGVVSFPTIPADLHLHLTQNGEANVLLSFPQSPSTLTPFRTTTTTALPRSDRISRIKSALEDEASSTQARVISHLTKSGLSFSSLWITNQIYVRNAPLPEIEKLSEFSEILKISLEREHALYKPDTKGSPSSSPISSAEWGVDKINAEAALSHLRNVSGGVIPEIRVGVMSTGVHATHTVLTGSFLGAYGWFDPHGSLTPVDEVGVGSHETGVIAGSGGVGVFPSGKWMNCRACESFGCTEFSVLKCAEFMTCPFLPDETMPDCSKAPHVVHGDIWTPAGDDWFDKPLEVWEAAEIIPVWPVGGQGPECLTVRYPSESSKVITVGGTTTEDVWYDRSSAGPAPTSRRLKPEIVAPAVAVLSAWNLDDDTLLPLSGTSVGSAHVAGVVALLKGYDPSLTFTQVLIALARGAEREGLGLGTVEDRECGSIPIETFPNNVFGFGRVDALASLHYVIQHS